MNKRRIRCVILGLLICLTFSVTSYGAEIPEGHINVNDGGHIITKAEQVRWYYRTTSKGVKQKRLWSVTYGHWKTNWIKV